MIEPAKIQVRFADCDMMGHVNNAVYLSYFEQARLHYFEKMAGNEWDFQKQGMILVKNEIEYIKPVFLHDKPEIFIHLVEIGTKSFTLGYKVMVGKELKTTGLSVLVCFDFHQNKSVSVYPEFVKAFSQLKEY
ncbi:MAG: acyl-CoA thioesterase [Brumimicrobium sp.]|nr:acyl-CoA thioesterase [Brumimicrobium sp.]